MPEFTTLKKAVADNLHDGDIAAFEGFTHLIPHAAAHEVIRQGRKNLTLIRMTPDIIYDQMIGLGMVKRLIFSYAGNPGVGLLRRLRDAIENAYPTSIEVVEHSHAAMSDAYAAGASGMPFAVFRGYLGTDLPKVNPYIKTIVCPFTGEELAAIPAIRPDVTLLHAQKANARGDILVEGILGVQKEAALAAKRVVVTVEEIVPEFENRHPNLCILPHWTVNAIALVPGGAHPSYAHGYYDRDNAAYLHWDKVSADRDLFAKWMTENVFNASPEVFADRIKEIRK